MRAQLLLRRKRTHDNIRDFLAQFRRHLPGDYTLVVWGGWLSTKAGLWLVSV